MMQQSIWRALSGVVSAIMPRTLSQTRLAARKDRPSIWTAGRKLLPFWLLMQRVFSAERGPPWDCTDARRVSKAEEHAAGAVISAYQH